MHSIAPYTLRCYDSSLPGKDHTEKYSKTNSIRSFDLFELLKKFIESTNEKFITNDERKTVFRYVGFQFDPNKRQIYGWIQSGHYGLKSDIINVDTSEVDFRKTQSNADIIDHFIHINLPINQTQGVALLHLVRGLGTKTTFFENFSEFFKKETTLSLQMNPLSYAKAFAAWNDAVAKEVKLIGTNKDPIFNDLTDQIKNIVNNGTGEMKMILIPARSENYGKYKDFFVAGSKESKLIEILEPLSARVQVTFDNQHGKKRTFNFGHNSSNTISEIDIPDTIIDLNSGGPKQELILNLCNEISSEFFS
ncbi:hypothetical protein [Nitrosomonas ureae]|uniref:Uncharacterized protein n=1 Tax=Nitrosomonas ureae TaxID=44577 RepID=A0A2T5IST4_9PROT|nr:hypothetical protein [Nitrosomonas ureae]PTQ86899.1 hypothetical protein C8R28_100894 [Nitrosomonas ureae]